MADNSLVKQSLTAQQRIAVLLASLDSDVAAQVMQELEPHVMNRAVEEVRRLGIVPGNVRQQAITESLEEISSFNSSVFGGDGVAVGLLGKIVGEHKAVSMLDLGSRAGERFGALAVHSPEDIARLLEKEPVGVCSLVLRHLPSDLSAKALELFDAGRRKKIVMQIATTDLPDDEVIERVEAQLAERISGMLSGGAEDCSRLDSVVSILQRSSKEVCDAILEELEQDSPDLAAKVRDQMFVFEDVVRLDDASIRKILQELENGILSVALRKTKEEVKERFYSNMSRRAVEALEEEMEYAGKMPFSEVQAKQKMVVETARKLASAGEIQLSVQEEEYV